MLMMLDITDALSLILERSGRRTELQIPTMQALFYTRRSLWRRRDGYAKRLYPDRNGRNHSVGRGVDNRNGVGAFKCHLGSISIRRDGYPNRTSANRNGRNYGIGGGSDDRNGGIIVIH